MLIKVPQRFAGNSCSVEVIMSTIMICMRDMSRELFGHNSRENSFEEKKPFTICESGSLCFEDTLLAGTGQLAFIFSSVNYL